MVYLWKGQKALPIYFWRIWCQNFGSKVKLWAIFLKKQKKQNNNKVEWNRKGYTYTLFLSTNLPSLWSRTDFDQEVHWNKTAYVNIFNDPRTILNIANNWFEKHKFDDLFFLIMIIAASSFYLKLVKLKGLTRHQTAWVYQESIKLTLTFMLSNNSYFISIHTNDN